MQRMERWVAIWEASRSQRHHAKTYLELILSHSKANPYFQVHSSTSIFAVPNRDCPPSEELSYKVFERLEMSAAYGIISIERKKMGIILNQSRCVMLPVIAITRFNADILPQALKQEQLLEANKDNERSDDISTLDVRAWFALPQPIKENWRSFNDDLRSHIMHCMMNHLRMQPKAFPAQQEPGPESYSMSYNRSILFTTDTPPEFPHIPVKFIPSKLNIPNEPTDLMSVLVSASIPRTSLSLLCPASHKDGGLRYRINLKDEGAAKPII